MRIGLSITMVILLATPASAEDRVAEITANGGCVDCDLRLASLRGLSLEGADFSESKLIEADLKQVNLPGANFSGARMQRIEMEQANLAGANFSDAGMRDADLEKSNLAGANLNDADLRDADPVSYTHLDAADE